MIKIGRNISRLSYRADDDGSGGVGDPIEEYLYLGLSTVVERAQRDGVTLTFVDGPGNPSADGGTGTPGWTGSGGWWTRSG